MKEPFELIDGFTRPEHIRDAVEIIWSELKNDTLSTWTYNGDKGLYGLVQVNEYLLLKSIILNTYPERKEFYVLDIGAGFFCFGDAIAKLLNEDDGIPQDIIVHVVGVRGERCLYKEVDSIQKCRLYSLGYFRIEDIVSEFKNRNLFFEHQFDLIVSQWTFRHLVDPLGTFLQVYNLLLRPVSGYFFVDGFSYLIEGSKPEQFNDDNMFRLLEELKALYLVEPYEKGRSMHRYAIQKPNAEYCWLPLQYECTVPLDSSGYQINANMFSKFKPTTATSLFAKKVRFVIDSDGQHYFGHQSIYDDLLSRGCLNQSALTYGSTLYILDTDAPEIPNEILASEVRPSSSSMWSSFFGSAPRKKSVDSEWYSCTIC